MPTSEARIEANRKNSLRSTGPKTAEGKARSRENALKHGMTGEGIALPVEDAAEVDRKFRNFAAELKPSGELGRTLTHRIALMAVRMDRCVAHETASLTEHIRQAEADFDAEYPQEEGHDDPDRERMRIEAARRALFDPSREATLARKYEAAAERCFFRSLKELRQVEAEAQASGTGPVATATPSSLGSFLPEDRTIRGVTPRDPEPAPKPSRVSATTFPVASVSPVGGAFDIPFAIGRVC